MTVRYTAGGNFTNYSNVYFEITPANIDGLKVSGLNKALPYTGKQVKAQPTLTYNGVKLNNSDFTFTYKNNVNIGTALMTITGKNFTGSKTVKFKIGKGIQPMKVKVLKKTVKKAALASESVEVSPIKVSNAVGKVSYKNVSKKAALKKFKVSSSGAITIPKGTKAGTYKIDVKVSAGGDKRYASGSKTVTATIRVK
jgi:hypothetical protein